MSDFGQVGVLLPLYKKDNPIFFHASVDSVLSQTYSNVIVFIGVDGPVENNLNAIIQGYESYSNVKIIRFKENRGLAAVLNDLIAESRAIGCDFFARMDADDISVPDRFEKQLKFLSDNPDIDVVGGSIEEIDTDSNKNGKKVVYPLTHEECRKFFRYRDPLAHPAVMFRPRYFEKTKGYRNEYRKNQDTMLWYDGFLNGCKFANLRDTVLYFRVTNDFYNRRNGWKRAKKMLLDRWEMNQMLHYDISAYFFAVMMFCMTVSPAFIKRLLYRIR